MPTRAATPTRCLAVWCATFALGGATAMGQDAPPPPPEAIDAAAFSLIDQFVVDGLEAWGVSGADLLSLRVRFVQTEGGWIGADAGDTTTPVRTLRSLRAAGPIPLDDSALAQIAQGIPSWMLEALGKEYGAQSTPRYAVDATTGVATFTIEPPGPTPGERVFEIRSVRGEGMSGQGLAESDVLALEVSLTPVADGLIGPRAGLPTETRTLGDITAGAEIARVYGSALQAIAETVVRGYSERDLRGVRVDVLPPTDGVLLLRVTEGVVGDVRTIAMGAEGEAATTNTPRLGRIAESSPVQRGELVDIEALDNYVYRLNRRPGRRVDIALAPGPGDDELTLDYLVAETSPITLYAQASNTGTDETTEWRQRFGLNHYNLSGVDDELLVDYVTGDFDEVHAVLASYERPFSFQSDWSWRAYGFYTEYNASQVGFAGQAFDGQTAGGGAELIWTFHQDGPAFLDGVLGFRYDDVDVDNNLASTEATNQFFLPYIGVKSERLTERSQTFGLLQFEGNLPDVADTETGVNLDGLGRLNASDEWIVGRAELTHSFYLEPLFDKNWGGEGSTLAHEVLLTGRIFYSFDDRLPPNFVQTLGGLYTIRGYPEAFSFGDQVYMATAEYRYHVPRALEPGDPIRGLFPGQPFRARPQQWLSRPDWDLILRGFIDAGRAENVDKLAFEQDTTLIGAGVGVELAIRRNINVRVDWGFALRDEQSNNDAVTSGSSQVHLVFTLVF